MMRMRLFLAFCTQERHDREYNIQCPLHNIVHQRREQLKAMVAPPNGSEIEREFVSPV